MIVNHLFSATVSPDKPLLYFAEHDTQLTNIALDPSSSKPSSSTRAVEPVIVKIEYEGPKIEGEHSDDEDDLGAELKDSDEDEDDEGDETGFVPVENKQVVICSLIPGQILQAQVNLLLVEDEQYRFVVSGGAYDVHLLGHYVSQPADLDSDLSPSDVDYYSDDDSLDSDELGQYSETDLGLHSKLGLIEGPIDSDDEDSDEDEEDEDVSYDSEEDDDDEGSSENDAEGRIQELKDEAEGLKDEASSPVIVPAAGAKSSLPNGTASKKRPLANDVIDADAEDEPADVSMATSDKSGDADTSTLSKNQRKKLAKKLKAANGKAVAPPVASSPAASAPAPAPGPAATTPAAAKKDVSAAAAAKKEAGEDKADKKQTISLPSGLKYHDSKPGTGPSCKPGQKVSMRYIGKLTSGKTFDKNTKGDPFRFTLGKGEVIKGWDEGVKGMKVGGERKLIVPADLAYGKRGAPPDIPSNATLVFEVKLLKIN